ncbi:MAG: ATP-binding protein [Desulfobacula sp.]|nr:ATP-binding protein [Desulfobacula sp.]
MPFHTHKEKIIHVKNSLATKLLTAVFSIYIILAVALTAIHMAAEYYQTKQDILKELKALQKTYESSLAHVIWDGDIEQLHVMVKGINESPLIIGVKINADMLEEFSQGLVINSNSDPVFSGPGNNQEQKKALKLTDVLEYEFPIVFISPSEKEQVGKMTFYYSSDMVFEKVKMGFLFIIVNSVIKTIILWILFIWIFRKLLSRPLSQLTMAIKKLRLDDLKNSKIEIKTSGRNELKVLEDSFNSMIQNLHFYMEKNKQTEEYLRESEEKFRGIFENSIEGIFQIDSQWKLIIANPSLAAIMGYENPGQLMSEGVFLGKQVYTDQEKRRGLLRRLKKEGRVSDFEIQVQKKDNTLIWISLNIWTIISEKGKASIMEGTLLDITDRQRTKEIMIQTEKMISVGGLAAGMAHEINNPLAGMMQNAQVIYNRLTKKLDANEKVAKKVGTSMGVIKAYMEQRNILRQLKSINEAGSHAAKIVANMLSFARKSNSVKQKHHLDGVIEKTLELAQNDYDLKKRYDFRQIEIIREFDPDLPAVLCEESKIQQVIFNIFKNAAEAIDEIKRKKRKPKLIIRLLKDKDTARIEIEDNGPGMDENIRNRIFEPFFTTKAVDKGTGLGLSVSYYIIMEDHKGQMSVESTLGKGTKFIIRLPAALHETK